MQLFINDLPAALPEDLAFNYFTESRYFSDAAGYSLDIDLPLEGCAENRAIFGLIERNPPKDAAWPARLICDGIDQTGSVLLLDVSKTVVKVQFLSGRSTADYGGSLEKVYINELEIDDGIFTQNLKGLKKADCMATLERIESAEYAGIFSPKEDYSLERWMKIPAVALTWVNDSEASVQNAQGGGYKIFGGRQTYPEDEWPESTRMSGLSWMPYLLPMARKIAEAVGYKVDFSKWDNSELRNLIICNALPAGHFSKDNGALTAQTYYEPHKALPHWNVLEFFDNIAPLLNGEFTFDHLVRTVRFDFSAEALQARPEVCPELVEDGYEITSSFGMEETEGNYLRALPWRYEDPGMEVWKYMDCPWWKPNVGDNYQTYLTPAEVVTMMRPFRNHWQQHSILYYAAEPQLWFCYYACHVNHHAPGTNEFPDIVPIALNLFGPERYDGPDGNYRTLSVLPAVVVNEYVRLNPEGCEDPTAQRFNEADDGEESDAEEPTTDILSEEYQTPPAAVVAAGEPDKAEGYYDQLYVGMYKGQFAGKYYASPESAGLRYGWAITAMNESFSMRLNDGRAPYADLPKIDESIKLTFYFHSRQFPDVNAVFNIDGRRYLCRRLEATLTAQGMSQRIKGEFYPIQE